jgi:hypothetical protein
MRIRRAQAVVVGPVAAQDRPAGDFPGSEVRPLDRPNGVTFHQRRICREISQCSGVNRGLAAGALNLLGFFAHGAEPLQIAIATLMGKPSHESFNNTFRLTPPPAHERPDRHPFGADVTALKRAMARAPPSWWPHADVAIRGRA